MARIAILLTFGTLLTAAPVPEPPQNPTVSKALAFLAGVQKPTGEFALGPQYEVAGTSLVILAFHSAGVRPNDPKYGDMLKKAAQFLVRTQQVDGFFKEPRASATMYSHGMATWALAEYAFASEKNGAKQLEPALARAVDLLVKCQSRRGGWRYTPRPVDADMSITTWQVLALRAASKAGFKVPEETFEVTMKFVEACRQMNRGFSYTPGGTPSPACTAGGTLQLLLAGAKPDSEELQALRDVILKGNNRRGTSYYFYTLHSQAQALARFTGKEADQGLLKIAEEIEKLKKDTGEIEAGPAEKRYGPVYATSLGVLTLTARDRKLGVHQTPKP